jgi:hypothetical protein
MSERRAEQAFGVEMEISDGGPTLCVPVSYACSLFEQCPMGTKGRETPRSQADDLPHSTGTWMWGSEETNVT